MSVQHVLMGVLAEGPAHGYDLKRAYDDRFPGAKALAYGQVYNALSRLQQDGFVEVAETSRDGGPERTAYALTTAGRAALDAWLAETEPAGGYAAVDLRLGADAEGFLGRQRAVHLARMRELVQQQQEVRDAGARIAIDHSIYHLDADLKWLETAAARVAAEGTGS
jgi:DNA-binding PadR family transcriptional regulator